MLEKIKTIFNNISRPGKIIILSVAGFVFLILLGFSVWRQCFRDDLRQYVNRDAVLYAHFNIPVLKNSSGYEELLRKILVDNGINTDLNLLDRQFALVCRVENNQRWCGTLVKIRHDDSSLTFTGESIKLSSKVFLIVADQESLEKLTPSSTDDISMVVKNNFSIFNSANIYLQPKFFSDPFIDLAINSSTNSQALFVYLKIRSGGKVMLKLNSTAAVKTKIPTNVFPGSWDVVLSVNNLSENLTSWRSQQLTTASWIDAWLADWLNTNDWEKTDKPLLFLAKKNNQTTSTGDFFQDYDFCLTVAMADVASIEGWLKRIAAERFPGVRIRTLTDGTRIREVKAAPEDFEFSEVDGLKVLDLPEGSGDLFYYLTQNKSGDQSLTASNNRQLACSNINLSRLRDYLFVRTELLPDIGLAGYLKAFDNVRLEGKRIILQ